MACRTVLFRSNFLINNSSQLLKRNKLEVICRYFKSSSQKQTKSTSKLKLAFLATAGGIGAGTAYAYSQNKERNAALLNPVNQSSVTLLDKFPDVKISKKVTYPTDSSGLKLTLFQYTTCPFCCKVRAFLDYYGISYDIIEVNPVFRQQMKWTDYKKVPILLVKHGNKYLQLNDSSMIISALTSYLLDKDVGLVEIANNFPAISFVDDDGKTKKEILNRYFLMYHGNIPAGRTKENIVEERKWRKWADDVLVHTLSPNVYRTTEEALQAFNWFSEVGEWRSNFSALEMQTVIYVGAFAMWLIGKRLKRRHRLKEDVRQSLYEETGIWLRQVKKSGGPFHGGQSPNLADLAVYGVLNSIEGCDAFRDLLLNTSLGKWYSAMSQQVHRQSGTPLLVHS